MTLGQVYQVAAGLLTNPAIQKEAGNLLNLFTKTAGATAGAEAREGLDLATNFLKQFEEQGSNLRECLKARVSALQGSLHSHGALTSEQEDLLSRLLGILGAGTAAPDAEDIRGLIEIVESLHIPESFSSTISPPYENTTFNSTQGSVSAFQGQISAPLGSKSHTVDRSVEVEKSEIQKASQPSTEEVGQGQDDTSVVLENLLGLLNAKITKRNGHVYMFLKWAGPALKFFGIDVPTPEELPKKVKSYLTENEMFLNAMRAVIENKAVVTSGMTWIQKMALSSSKKLLNYTANHPEAVLEGGPQAAYALKFMSGTFIPIVGSVPIVGRLLRWAYPFVVDEMNSAGELKEREYLSTILERLAKYHTTNQAESPAESTKTSN